VSTNRCEDSIVSALLHVLTDIQHEDSGNYTCEVNGPHNALLGSVTHYIYVRGADYTFVRCTIYNV